MKYEIPGCNLTIKCYKTTRKKIKIYYVNKYMKKPVVIPYSKVALTNLENFMKNQLKEFIKRTDTFTIDTSKYLIYNEFSEEFVLSSLEKEMLDIKKMDININTIDNYSTKEVEDVLIELRLYRQALYNLVDNKVYCKNKKCI